MTAKQVADTIISQIGMTAGKIAMMSWGFRTPQYGTETNGNHFLIFSVSGFLHKGKVKVILAGNDTYTIHLLNRDGSTKKSRDTVYCDEIGGAIDEMVEHPGNDEED